MIILYHLLDVQSLLFPRPSNGIAVCAANLPLSVFGPPLPAMARTAASRIFF